MSLLMKTLKPQGCDRKCLILQILGPCKDHAEGMSWGAWSLKALKCGKCYVHCVFWNKFSENLNFQWLSPLRLRQNRWRRDPLRVIVELSGPWESLLLRKKFVFSGCHQLQEEYCNSFFFFLFFCIFILFMGFSSQEYWSGLPFSSSVNHVLSDSVDMSLSKLQEMMKDRNLECCNSWGCKKLDTT